MNNLDVMFSKKSDIWSTPQDLFDKLDNEFHFNIDVCANDSNHKCSKYFTEQDDGLSKDWHGTVQMNPPYSACKDQIRKAFESSAGGGNSCCSCSGEDRYKVVSRVCTPLFWFAFCWRNQRISGFG